MMEWCRLHPVRDPRFREILGESLPGQCLLARPVCAEAILSQEIDVAGEAFNGIRLGGRVAAQNVLLFVVQMVGRLEACQEVLELLRIVRNRGFDEHELAHLVGKLVEGVGVVDGCAVDALSVPEQALQLLGLELRDDEGASPELGASVLVAGETNEIGDVSDALQSRRRIGLLGYPHEGVGQGVLGQAALNLILYDLGLVLQGARQYLAKAKNGYDVEGRQPAGKTEEQLVAFGGCTQPVAQAAQQLRNEIAEGGSEKDKDRVADIAVVAEGPDGHGRAVLGPPRSRLARSHGTISSGYSNQPALASAPALRA